jgi:hypothetical protein
LTVGVGKVTHGLVEVAEVCGEDEGGDEAGNGKSGVGPDEVRVVNNLGEGELDGVRDGLVEETNSIDLGVSAKE